MTHRTLIGRIQYLSEKPDRFGQERGREVFAMTHHGDGSRTLTAHCEIDDAPSVIRDVSLTVDSQWHPQDCSVRLMVGGDFTGSGWFRFSTHEAECETFTRAEGRLRQRIGLAQPLRCFGNHAISSDGWLMNVYDLAQGIGTQRIERALISSPDHRGATGPTLFQLSFGVGYLGREKITVKAGTFDAHHFQVLAPDLPEEHPPYDVWTTADGDYVMLKGRVTGYMKTYYELISLERVHGG
ncbi:MAG: DUF3108 domain-containing protein [Alphaproteobacteria bacterium]|nr:DUF3108 domain-containing protein [Alphaproteobacteria bacterium]